MGAWVERGWTDGGGTPLDRIVVVVDVACRRHVGGCSDGRRWVGGPRDGVMVVVRRCRVDDDSGWFVFPIVGVGCCVTFHRVPWWGMVGLVLAQL